MKFHKWLKKFARDDSGAVTVDWVVLTSLVVVLGIWAISIYTNGTLKAMGEVETYLSGIEIN